MVKKAVYTSKGAYKDYALLLLRAVSEYDGDKRVGFKRFDLEVWKNTWYILPTIAIVADDMIYGVHNISIQVHFLCVHCRWLWLQKS